MSRVYDGWEKLVGAVLDREELRRLALCESFDTSTSSDFSSRFSFDSAAASSMRSNFSYHAVRPIELSEIIKATENFKPAMLIGAGAMFQAYKAWIDEHGVNGSEPESRMAVTVKRWYNTLGRPQDWLKGINYMVQLHHPNLVDLVGYCTEKDNFILVYKFMPQGSLHNHLFTTRHQSLPWVTRIKVALDVARGLSYLHDREIPIIHRDLKTPNIFLDWELNAKLSNYCYGTDDPIGEMSYVSTNQIFVDHSYTAPEYTSKGHLTTKSNVYTFGAVLTELLSGFPASNLNWVKPYLSNKSKLLHIMDSRLGGQYSHDAAYKAAKLALKCLNRDPKSRPKIADVVVSLHQLL